jgi:hypothetical protein
VYRLSVCLYVCMGMDLASTRTVGPILFIFGIQEFIQPRSVPVESEYSSSKNRGTLNET